MPAIPTHCGSWGEFDIQIRIIFVSESAEKPLSFYHHLKLHPWPAVPSLEAENPDPPVPVDRPDPVHSWQYDEVMHFGRAMSQRLMQTSIPDRIPRAFPSIL